LYLEVEAQLSDTDHFCYQGEGELPDTADNLIHRAFQHVYHQLKQPPPPVTFYVTNAIPLARGLGSSSAALIAGMALADALLGAPLGRHGIFQLAAATEGHPDNVAPAIYGGFTVSVSTERGFISEALPLPESWQLLFGVPDFELLTSQARAVVPARYERQDVIHSTGRTALWSLAVSQDRPELLRIATQDVLHEPYREALVPGLAQTRQALMDCGAYAAFLSGAGPSLGVICHRAQLDRCTEALEPFVGAHGRVLHLPPAAGLEHLESAS
jgi:homoserine kinase